MKINDRRRIMRDAITLQVGQMHHLRRGKDNIIYAGMISEDIFSIVQRKEYGYQGYSWNLYFPRRQQDIVIDGVDITVENVNHQEIRFRVG
jgi:hypothetical protein